jgi:hypothetical protein
MTFKIKNAVLTIALLSATSDAFMSPASTRTFTPTKAFVQSSNFKSVPLYATDGDNDDEIGRLKAMAAKLRAEAAGLEAEKAQQVASAAEKAFKKFDLNQDGMVSLTELKAGLEKSLKMELSENRVKKLLEDFDKTGDGTLQLEDFVGVEKFRNRLEAMARDEKSAALELAKTAKKEEEASKFLEAQMELINDKPPTGTEKFLSVLPYLFPLLDGLQFGRFLVNENPENIFAGAVALLYTLYRSIPFGGFIAFIALNTLSGNPSINRLIRFNMQQAIYLDIALFFPSLIAGLAALIGQSAGFQFPPALTEIGDNALFFTLLATIAYSSISSLAGVTPDKIPLLSEAVSKRMPSVDMFDDQGRFKPSEKKDNDEKKE